MLTDPETGLASSSVRQSIDRWNEPKRDHRLVVFSGVVQAVSQSVLCPTTISGVWLLESIPPKVNSASEARRSLSLVSAYSITFRAKLLLLLHVLRI